jgi:isoleucyl-tRNA synthetase
LEDFPKPNVQWDDECVVKDFAELFRLREKVQFELEKARQQKIIGQSLDAQVLVTIGAQHTWRSLIQMYYEQLPECFIVSAVHITETDGDACDIAVKHADGVRCPRTWRWVDKLVEVDGFGAVSERCAEVLRFRKQSL